MGFIINTLVSSAKKLFSLQICEQAKGSTGLHPCATLNLVVKMIFQNLLAHVFVNG